MRTEQKTKSYILQGGLHFIAKRRNKYKTKMDRGNDKSDGSDLAEKFRDRFFTSSLSHSSLLLILEILFEDPGLSDFCFRCLFICHRRLKMKNILI